MPVKERYWKNPDHHRAWARKRQARLVAQGMPYRFQLSPAAAERWRQCQVEYRKKHRKANALSQRRLRQRMKKIFGTSGQTGQWRYHLLVEEKKLAKRKSRAATLLS